MNKSHFKAKLFDKTATVILYISAIFFILLLLAMTLYIVIQGLNAIMPGLITFSGDFPFVSFYTPSSFAPEMLGFFGDGIGIQFFNTVYLVTVALIVSVPIGILAGIYMAEYSKPGPFTSIIRTCIETLSSLPSIVVGLFAFLIFVELTHMQYNMLAGSGAVSILSIPLIARVTEDAIRDVPDGHREGSYSLGATKWQTIVRVLFPTAIPRIITGIILAAGRGFGEAAALIYTAGMTSDVNFNNWNIMDINSPLNPFRQCDTLAVHIWAIKAEGSDYLQKYANLSAATLVIMVLLFNIGSRLIGRLIEKRIQGK